LNLTFEREKPEELNFSTAQKKKALNNLKPQKHFFKSKSQTEV
jgi:hypothetical protein